MWNGGQFGGQLRAAPGAGQPLDQDDFASRNWTGLPSWAEASAQKLWGKYGGKGLKSYRDAISGLDQVPELVGKMRDEQMLRYTRGIQNPTRSAINSTIEQAAGRGTLGSTMYGDAMARVSDRLAAAGADENAKSNIWADNSILQNLGNKVQANSGFAALMAQLLASTRRSEGYTPNYMGMDGSPY